MPLAWLFSRAYFEEADVRAVLMLELLCLAIQQGRVHVPIADDNYFDNAQKGESANLNLQKTFILPPL